MVPPPPFLGWPRYHRLLCLLDDLSKRELAVTDGALIEYFRANAKERTSC